MNNLIVISALVLTSSMASAVTVRGTGRAYTGTAFKTIKEACSAASASAKQSLSDRCSFIGGQLTSDSKLVLEPQDGPNEDICTAQAEADCQ